MGASSGFHMEPDQRSETLVKETTSPPGDGHALLIVRDIARLLRMSER